MIWELEGFNTDQRYDDIRYREYTASERKANLFRLIPKIQFTDSGHGIVFSSRPHPTGKKRKPVINGFIDINKYVRKQMEILRNG